MCDYERLGLTDADDGWHAPSYTQLKWHYFKGGQSLCSSPVEFDRYSAIGVPLSMEDCCSKCYRPSITEGPAWNNLRERYEQRREAIRRTWAPHKRIETLLGYKLLPNDLSAPNLSAPKVMSPTTVPPKTYQPKPLVDPAVYVVWDPTESSYPPLHVPWVGYIGETGDWSSRHKNYLPGGGHSQKTKGLMSRDQISWRVVARPPIGVDQKKWVVNQQDLLIGLWQPTYNGTKPPVDNDVESGNFQT